MNAKRFLKRASLSAGVTGLIALGTLYAAAQDGNMLIFRQELPQTESPEPGEVEPTPRPELTLSPTLGNYCAGVQPSLQSGSDTWFGSDSAASVQITEVRSTGGSGPELTTADFTATLLGDTTLSPGERVQVRVDAQIAIDEDEVTVEGLLVVGDWEYPWRVDALAVDAGFTLTDRATGASFTAGQGTQDVGTITIPASHGDALSLGFGDPGTPRFEAALCEGGTTALTAEIENTGGVPHPNGAASLTIDVSSGESGTATRGSPATVDIQNGDLIALSLAQLAPPVDPTCSAGEFCEVSAEDVANRELQWRIALQHEGTTAWQASLDLSTFAETCNELANTIESFGFGAMTPGDYALDIPQFTSTSEDGPPFDAVPCTDEDNDDNWETWVWRLENEFEGQFSGTGNPEEALFGLNEVQRIILSDPPDSEAEQETVFNCFNGYFGGFPPNPVAYVDSGSETLCRPPDGEKIRHVFLPTRFEPADYMTEAAPGSNAVNDFREFANNFGFGPVANPPAAGDHVSAGLASVYTPRNPPPDYDYDIDDYAWGGFGWPSGDTPEGQYRVYGTQLFFFDYGASPACSGITTAPGVTVPDGRDLATFRCAGWVELVP